MATAIDKEAVKFDGGSYKEHQASCSALLSIEFFKSKNAFPDQYLAMVHEISQALVVTGDSKQCDFDRIFCNSRVMATPELAKDCKEKCENLKKTAQSIVVEFKDELVLFRERETFRKQIADIVAAEIKDVANPEDLKQAIIKDLRGPYYQAHFAEKQISAKDVGNKKLIESLVNDFKAELVPVAQKQHVQARRL